MKSVVTVSRRWDHPKILTVVDVEGISMRMSLADFIEAMKAEMSMEDYVSAIKEAIGPVRWTFRDQTWESQFMAAVDKADSEAWKRQLSEAAQRVIKGMKEESAKVV